jgi:hypothetical protein
MPQDDRPGTGKDADRRAFREAVAARRERLVRGGRGFAAALIALVAAAVLLRVPEAWWVPAVGFVAVAGLAFRLVNWTCPACGERLPTRGGRTCRGCGATIDA